MLLKAVVSKLWNFACVKCYWPYCRPLSIIRLWYFWYEMELKCSYFFFNRFLCSQICQKFLVLHWIVGKKITFNSTSDITVNPPFSALVIIRFLTFKYMILLFLLLLERLSLIRSFFFFSKIFLSMSLQSSSIIVWIVWLFSFAFQSDLLFITVPWFPDLFSEVSLLV